MGGIDVTEYLSLVEQEAKYLCRNRPAIYSLEYGDFYGAGCLGLVQAADKWVPGLTSAPFSAYARKWVRGHMYKLLRQELKAHCRGEPRWPARRETGQARRLESDNRKLVHIDDVESSVPGDVGTEDRVLFQVVLERLPKIEYDVLSLRYLAGYDGKDTAWMLGLKGGPPVISVIKKRASLRLREWFGLPSTVKHGTLDAYRYCKCEVCREEKAKKNSQEWERRKAGKPIQAGTPGKSGASTAAHDGMEVETRGARPARTASWNDDAGERDELALAS